jgi:hypothetical protein
MRGGVDAHGKGACPWTPASVVARPFGQAMSAEGEGGHPSYINPLPPGCDLHQFTHITLAPS